MGGKEVVERECVMLCYGDGWWGILVGSIVGEWFMLVLGVLIVVVEIIL